MVVKILMIIMAAGAVVGGLDHIFGNKLGLGEKFKEGFQLLGPLAMAQAGIICLSVPFAQFLGPVIKTVYPALGQDPAMFGSILAIDMGGYQMSMELAVDAEIGRFAGIVAASMLGCTVVYTIPVGMGFLAADKRDAFSKGILLGLIALPAALFAGALFSGISALYALVLCLPVIVLSVIMAVLLHFFQAAAFRFFKGLAWFVRAVSTLGIIIGAVSYMTGWEIIPGLVPLTEALEIVCAVAIVLLGSLPIAELLNRLLKKPLASLSGRLGMSEASLVNILVCVIAVTPALAALKDMEKREITVNAAFSVCAASLIGAHLGFTLAMEPELAMASLGAKFLGGILGVGTALAFCRVRRKNDPEEGNKKNDQL